MEELPVLDDESSFEPAGGTGRPEVFRVLRSSTRADTVLLSGGIVAHNEEANVQGAIHSLLTQELPEGVRWGTIWVVASGCSDRTVERALRVAEMDRRVRVVIEAERHGKARAITEILCRARGDALVLLNADARAMPGSVAALWSEAKGRSPPFAVMARNEVGATMPGPFASSIRLFWKVHNDLHRVLMDRHEGNHLSDELMLVSIQGTPKLPDGVINDGAFLGAWLTRHGGERRYASDAGAWIQVPSNFRDHVIQRRRIRVGHSQVARLLRVTPNTLVRATVRHPVATLAIIRNAVRREGGAWGAIILLGVAELASTILSFWDRIPPRKDHVRWQRIRPGLSWPLHTGP